MTAIDAILSFDGKHVGQLEAALQAGISDEIWAEIVACLGHSESRFQIASTWLVKGALESSRRVPDFVICGIFDALSALSCWQARLHVLQSIRYLRIKDSRRPDILAFIADCDNCDNALVRVWALDGFVRLAGNDSKLRDAAGRRLRQALRSGAASMRARARHLDKEFPELADIRDSS